MKSDFEETIESFALFRNLDDVQVTRYQRCCDRMTSVDHRFIRPGRNIDLQVQITNGKFKS